MSDIPLPPGVITEEGGTLLELRMIGPGDAFPRPRGKRTHGHTAGPAGSRRGSPTYLSWLAMRARCLNPNNEKFYLYGGRGIRVCERWAGSFENFLADMGERPEGRTLDRKNGHGHYEPDNCRWATPKQQGENSDRIAKGWKGRRTCCARGHAFTEENTDSSRGHRRCKTCDNINAAARRCRKAASRNAAGI